MSRKQESGQVRMRDVCGATGVCWEVLRSEC